MDGPTEVRHTEIKTDGRNDRLTHENSIGQTDVRTERETHRQTDQRANRQETELWTDGQTDINRETDIGQSHRNTHRQKNRWTDHRGLIGRQSCGRMNEKTGRLTDKQT